MALTIIITFIFLAFITIGFINTFRIIQIRRNSTGRELSKDERNRILRYFLYNAGLFFVTVFAVFLTYLVNSMMNETF